MNRLTEKLQKGIYDINNKNYAFGVSESLNKLGQLEDIEEELGIDLITLFKALKNGFYAKEIHTKQNIQIYHIEPEEFVITFGKVLGHFITIQELYFEDLDGVLDTTGKKWYPEDYGKTWALTKEELEK